MGGDGRRADVDSDTRGTIGVAGVHRADGGAVAHGHGDRVVAILCCRGEQGEHAGVDLARRDVEVAGERVDDLLAEPADLSTEFGRWQFDVVQPDHRVDLEVAEVDRLAHDLAMHLARCGNLDDHVAAYLRRTAEALSVADRPSTGVAVLGRGPTGQ